MGRFGSLTLSGVLTLLLITAGSTATGEQNSQAKRLQQITVQIERLAESISEDTRTREILQTELRDTEKLIGELAADIRTLQVDIAHMDQRVTALELEQLARRQSLEQHRQRLKSLMMSAYMTGRQERIKLLLNQQDPATVNRMMIYFEYFNRQRIEHIQAGQRLIAEIGQTRKRLDATRQQLENGRQQQQQQLDGLHQARSVRERLVNSLDRDIDEKKGSLQQLTADAEQLRQLLEQLREQQQVKRRPAEKFSSLRGNLDWPVRGFLSKLYGSDKGGGVKWDGVFITAPEGREVQSIHHGKVAYADWLRGYGLLLIVDHGEGYMSLYGHNQSLFKEVGESVAAGETVALTGNSGGQKTTGLYFSIRKAGKPTNPKKWCIEIKGRTI